MFFGIRLFFSVKGLYLVLLEIVCYLFDLYLFNMFKIRYRYKSDYSICNFKILEVFNEMMILNLLKKNFDL